MNVVKKNIFSKIVIEILMAYDGQFFSTFLFRIRNIIIRNAELKMMAEQF